MAGPEIRGALFDVGDLYATPAAKVAMEARGANASALLRAHAKGEWGHMSEEDQRANKASIVEGTRILSSYKLAMDLEIWIITEAKDEDGHRPRTTFLLPNEY